MEHVKTYQAPVYYLFGLWKERRRIVYMAFQDLKNNHVKSYLGSFWAYFQPIVMMLLIVLIFTYGFRTGSVSGNLPFVVYFVTGYVSWNFIAGMFSSGANSITSYSFLIKKVDFPLYILPLVKLLADFLVHFVILLVVAVVIVLNGVYPDLYWIQVLYYLAASIVLLFGVSLFTASVSLFVPDVNRIIPIVTQIGFWATPIFWNPETFPASMKFLVKLNPAFYIVNGYRESFVYGVGFWEHPLQFFYFWSLTLLILVIGAITYRNTRPHFAEVVP